MVLSSNEILREIIFKIAKNYNATMWEISIQASAENEDLQLLKSWPHDLYYTTFTTEKYMEI